MEEAPDEILMSRYMDGDEQAFEALFKRYEHRAYAYFRRRAGCEQRAWDMYQEIFLRLHRFRHTYDSSRPFSPWFFQIAHRVLIDDARQSYRSREIALGECPEPSQEAEAEKRVVARQILALLLGSLSKEQARVVMAAKIDGPGYAEIAKGLGKSVDSVKQAASRALRALRSEARMFDLAPVCFRRGRPD